MSHQRLAALLALACVLLAGCGGRPPAPPVPAVEAEQARAMEAGLRAFADGRLAQAEQRFRHALELAYRRDDTAGVVDARYNLAATLVERGAAQEAVVLLAAAQAELARTGREPGRDLLLLAATAHYRAGESVAAEAAARRVIAGGQDALVPRAWYLLGRLAADAGDAEALATAIAAIGPTADPRLGADRLELEGRQAAAQGAVPAALERLGAAARLRARGGEFRASARALAAAADAAARGGLDTEAARHYLRAGRSAAASGAIVEAREWLTRAEALGRRGGDAATADEATTILGGLEPTSPGDGRATR